MGLPNARYPGLVVVEPCQVEDGGLKVVGKNWADYTIDRRQRTEGRGERAGERG
jgi:hypothetical protein